MRVPTSLLCACSLLFVLPVQAQEPRNPTPGPVVEAEVGNDSVQLRYLSPGPNTGLDTDLDYGLLIYDPHTVIASTAWMFHTDFENLLPILHLQVGPEANLASLANLNRGVLSISLGADALLDLIPRFGLSAFASFFYAPSVFVFGSANNVYDLTAGAQLQFAPRLLVLAGYRWFHYDLQNAPNQTIQNGLFVGVRWNLQ